VTAPIRVAVVARSVYPLHGHGGLERHVFDLTRYLADAGLQVTLITRQVAATRANQPETGTAAVHPRVRVMTVPYRTFPLAGRRGTTVIDRSTAYPIFGERAGRVAFSMVKRGEIDIVHGLGASVLGYARRRANASAPLVMNPQGLEEFGATAPGRARLKRLAYWPLQRAVLACAHAADRVIATDRALEASVREHLELTPDRVVTIPNAIDLPALDRAASAAAGAHVRRDLGIEDDEFVILSVGRLEENKGFHVLAAALGALADHSPVIAGGKWKWVLIGDGPYRGALVRAIAEAGLTARTRLPGRLDDATLHAWYETASLFVHPTLYEGSSLVTLEAMSHARTVVATNAGGLPDKVKTGVNGWLVPAGDASALAAAISGALGPGVDLASMGRRGRALVEREFSWDAAAVATIRLYEELLGGSLRK
jgi:glycosyltransferase involved in cell wall biosynthesis